MQRRICHRLHPQAAVAVLIGALAAGAPAVAQAQSEDGAAPSPVAAVTAGAPRTDIYLAPIGGVDEYVLLGRARNLTPRVGYDNQPAFSPDGRALYYSAIHEDGQADLYRLALDVEDATPERLTHTTHMSEYSPTPLPWGGGLSTVRVEPDGAQQLWRLTEVGTDVSRIVPSLPTVGYHAWLDRDSLALFLVGEPLSLVHARREDRQTLPSMPQVQTIASNIGRALVPLPGRAAVAFVQVLGEDQSELHVFDAQTASTTRWAGMPPGGSGDFAIDPTSGAAFTVLDRTLLRLPADGERWLTVGQLIIPGGAISRLAISAQGNRLALVVAEEEAPQEAGD